MLCRTPPLQLGYNHCAGAAWWYGRVGISEQVCCVRAALTVVASQSDQHNSLYKGSLPLSPSPIPPFLCFLAPAITLSITGGRPMRLERVCMSLVANWKAVFIARGILL